MQKLKIDENFNEVLNLDPIHQTEKLFGKHYSEFDDNQNNMMLANAFLTNQLKSDYLKSLGDTHFSMKWNEFLEIIKGYGFLEALQYEFDYEDKKEKAIIYYHPIKGLVIWATSFWNGESVNGGTLYGQIKYEKPIEFVEKSFNYSWNSGTYQEMIMTDELLAASRSLNGCSHDAISEIGTGIAFSYDIREALINKITQIEKHLEFRNPWVTNQFLWFADFVETKKEGYDYKHITEDKIKRCPVEFQNIVKSYNSR